VISIKKKKNSQFIKNRGALLRIKYHVQKETVSLTYMTIP